MDHKPSPSLLALPPEIRNIIYGYVFAFDSQQKIPLQAAQATAPELALLLTCRQIHDQAQGLHAEETEAFWTDLTFTVDVSGAMAEGLTPAQLAQAVNLRQLLRITRLDIEVIVDDTPFVFTLSSIDDDVFNILMRIKTPMPNTLSLPQLWLRLQDRILGLTLAHINEEKNFNEANARVDHYSRTAMQHLTILTKDRDLSAN